MMKKRILAILLACFMIVSVMPFSAFAENADHDHVESTQQTCPGAGEKHSGALCTNPEKVKEVKGPCDGYDYVIYKCECGDYFASDFKDSENGEHTWDEDATVEPTCTEAGKKVCSACETEEEIPATGHSFENGKCTVCDAIENAEDCGEGNHVYVAPPAIKEEPSCTKNGVAVYTCDNCGKEKEVTIVAHEHKIEEVEAKEATCTEKGNIAYSYCTVCEIKFVDGEIYEESVEIEVIDHTWDEVVTKEPTCEEKGLKELTCSVCGVKDEVELDPAHAWAELEPTDATCTGFGHEGGKVCTACGEYEFYSVIPPKGHDCGYENKEDHPDYPSLEREICTEEIVFEYVCVTCENEVKEVVVAADVCDYEFVVVEAPTCNTTGLKAYQCSVCGNIDEDGETEELPIDKNEHKYEEVENVGNAPTCTEDGDRLLKCVYCEDVKSETVPALGHSWDEGSVTDDATCTEDGEKTFTCEACGETKSETVAAPGHKLDKETVDATCAADGYVRTFCENCDYEEIETKEGSKLSTELGKLYSMEDVEAVHKNIMLISEVTGSCTVAGIIVYRCDDCGVQVFVREEGTGKGHTLPENYDCTVEVKCEKCGDTVPANEEHNFEVVTEATCEESGEEKCSVCGATNVIDALGHTDDIVLEAVEPTCTETGLTEGKKCSVCEKITVEQEVVSALGHNHDNNVLDSDDADCVNFGYQHKICTVCGDEYIDSYVPALGHEEVVDEAVDATCTETGLTEGKHCSVCEKITVEQEVVDKVAHKDADGEFTSSCKNTGEERICEVCGTSNTSEHNIDTVIVGATCKDFGYIIEVCVDCGEIISSEVNDETLDHTWAPVFAGDPDYVSGVRAEKCSVCGKYREVGKFVDFSFDIDNAVKSGAGYADSSLVSVTVNIDADSLELWGTRFLVLYNENYMEFVGAEFVSDKFTSNTRANAINGIVSITATTANAEGTEAINELVDGKEALVVLTFRVTRDIEESGLYGDVYDVWFGFGNFEVLNNVGDEFEANGETEHIIIGSFLDVNDDGDVNLADALYAYEIMINGEYSVAADVDKDGAVTPKDLNDLYDYLTKVKDYSDMIVA